MQQIPRTDKEPMASKPKIKNFNQSNFHLPKAKHLQRKKLLKRVDWQTIHVLFSPTNLFFWKFDSAVTYCVVKLKYNLKYLVLYWPQNFSNKQLFGKKEVDWKLDVWIWFVDSLVLHPLDFNKRVMDDWNNISETPVMQGLSHDFPDHSLFTILKLSPLSKF